METTTPTTPGPSPTAPLPIYNKDLRLLRQASPCSSPRSFPTASLPAPIPCMMFSPASTSYQDQFISLDKTTDSQSKAICNPYILPLVTFSGHRDETKQFEAVLNWQTSNARAQNSVLQQIDTRLGHVEQRLDTLYTNMKLRIQQLDTDLRHMLQHQYWGPDFDPKESEIRHLKAEIARIEAERKSTPDPPQSLFPRHSNHTPPPPGWHSFPPVVPPFTSFPTGSTALSQAFPMVHTLFPKAPITPSAPRPPPSHTAATPASTFFPNPSCPSKFPPAEPSHSASPHHQYSSQPILDSSSSGSLSPSDSEADDTDLDPDTDTLSKLLMATPMASTPPPDPSHMTPPPVVEDPDDAPTAPPVLSLSPYRPSNGPYFTFDDLPFNK